MKYSLALLAAAVAVQASPVAFPQGVTERLSASGTAPPGCLASYPGTLGVAVMNVSSRSAPAKRQVSTIADGQPQASTGPASPVSQISDGQIQATTGTAAPVSQISDGQIQATTGTAAPVSQISDGQIQATTGTAAPVSQISDGQVQATPAAPAPAATQISDGQVQAPTGAVSQIADGQIQAPTAMYTMAMVSQIQDGQIQAGMQTVTMMPVSQISDGQIQATYTYMPVTTIVDGQPQAPTFSLMPTSAVEQISDGQLQATTGSAVNTIADGQPQASSTAASASPSASGPAVEMTDCMSNSLLHFTLEDGVIVDDQGRTGYIAANFQLQYDDPPQTGALVTAGFSVCENGSLALGGSNIFYQCLSGTFNNLYSQSIGAQCNPITLQVMPLMECAE